MSKNILTKIRTTSSSVSQLPETEVTPHYKGGGLK